jgi:hypothetical protein
MNDFYSINADKFKFGWEVEMMVTDDTFTPLFGSTLSFERLQSILDMVKVDNIPYLLEKYIGSGTCSYYIEGYDNSYENGIVKNVITKGIEIRTPITFSIEDSVAAFKNHYNRMQDAMKENNLHISCFGNQPFQPSFKGDIGNRDVIGWASAEVAMTTNGLVINISLPDEIEKVLDRNKLNIRFSYAAPIMVLLSGNTPFRNGELWKPNGQQAYSDRSYRRSFVRDTVYYRDDQHFRKEITLFDMTNDLKMHCAYAALSLGILLSSEDVEVIPDRFSKENIRRVTMQGYQARLINRNFDEIDPKVVAYHVLRMSSKALETYGFNDALLKPLWELLDQHIMPSHNTIELFKKVGSIQGVIKERSQLISL